jgi:hypothetical protein
MRIGQTNADKTILTGLKLDSQYNNFNRERGSFDILS